MDITEQSYAQFFSPRQCLSVDESMVKFKGCIFFRQYMPAKWTKWGLKKFVLCDSKTGYCLQQKVYNGRESFPRNPDVRLGKQAVLDLTSQYQNRNHIIYMDNFCSNPQLFRKLQEQGIGATGTVNPLRKKMLEAIKPRNLV